MFTFNRIVFVVVLLTLCLSSFALVGSSVRVEFPYLETFDNISIPNLPAGWDSIIISSSSTASVESDSRTSSPSSPNCIRFKNASTTEGIIALVTPWTDEIQSKRISFQADGYSDNNSSLTLGILTDLEDIDQFEEVVTIPINSSWNQYEYTFLDQEEISGYLVLSMNLDNSYRRIYLDDFLIEDLNPTPPADQNEPQEIIIGTGDDTEHYLPIACYYNYTWSQSIYPSNEISTNNGEITKVAYFMSNPDYEWSDRAIIYLGQTELANYYDHGFIDYAEHTLVFNGEYCVEGYADNWLIFEFSQPFEYDPSLNLVVTVFDDSNATEDHGWGPRFYGTNVTEYQSIIARNDNFSYTDPDHNNPAYGMKKSIFPNIKIYFTESVIPNEPELSFNVDSLNFENIGLHQSVRDVITITNSSEVDAIIINICFANSELDQFNLIQQIDIPYTLSPDGTLSLEILYHSQETGYFSNQLLIDVNSIPENYELLLTGNSEDYNITETPFVNDFESENLNTLGWENSNDSWLISSESYSGNQSISAKKQGAIYQTPPFILSDNSIISFYTKNSSLVNEEPNQNEYYMTFEASYDNQESWEVLDTLQVNNSEEFSQWDKVITINNQSEVMF